MSKPHTKKPTTIKTKKEKDYTLLLVSKTDCSGYPIITKFGKEYYKIPKQK